MTGILTSKNQTWVQKTKKYNPKYWVSQDPLRRIISEMIFDKYNSLAKEHKRINDCMKTSSLADEETIRDYF